MSSIPSAPALTVYASIGNSDDKLTQLEWSRFTHRFVAEIRQFARVVHGSWYSAPGDPWQNMCVCFEIAESSAEYLKEQLALAARTWRQDSIAWAVVPATEFITPAASGA